MAHLGAEQAVIEGIQATRALHHDAVEIPAWQWRTTRRVALVGAAMIGVACAVVALAAGEHSWTPGSPILRSLSSLQEAPASATPAPSETPEVAGAPAATAPSPTAAADTGPPLTTEGAIADSQPVDCSGEPGGCMGTQRASKTLLPLAIFALIGACLYWSYAKFITVPGFTEAREKNVKTVVFTPARRAYDTFGHEVAGPV